MKKYIDWIIEGVILSAMVVAFLFVIGKGYNGKISFKESGQVIIFCSAIFAYVVAFLAIYLKKRPKKILKVLPIIYALENLIMYYVAVYSSFTGHSRIEYEALCLTFFVGMLAWPITMYEVENLTCKSRGESRKSN